MSDEVQQELEAIGAELRIARMKAYLTQSDVGQRAGVSRQLVSRIEQGCNGEISAYVSVAAALNHRFVLVEHAATSDTGMAALDFTSDPAAADPGRPKSPPRQRKTRGPRVVKRSPDDVQR